MAVQIVSHRGSRSVHVGVGGRFAQAGKAPRGMAFDAADRAPESVSGLLLGQVQVVAEG